MDTDDEDVFALNEEEDEIIELPQIHNPVEENLMIQLNEVEEQIERAKKENDNIEEVTNKILENLQRKALYYDPDYSSNSDTERYDDAGVPLAKRKRRKKSVSTPALIVTDVWQLIVDDKWVLGVHLQNTSNRILESPIIYVTIKGQNELQGVTSFWGMTEGALWNKIDRLGPDGGHTVATVVLDIPNFEESDVVEGHGVISYEIEGCSLQAPIHSFRLTAAQAIDKTLTPRHSGAFDRSILAIKAASVEKIVCIPLGQDLGAKLMEFMERHGFKEVSPDVHVSKNTETLRHCIIEIALGEEEVSLRIFARSTSQLNILLHILKDDIPEVTELDKPDKLLEAALALEREIESRLEGLSPREILNASILTDLLLPG